jgi:probable F420-dependent oxidoreductase
MPLPAYKVNAAFMGSKAEELGFESIWYAEHPVMPVHTTSRFPGSEDGEVPWTYSHFADPFIALAQASGATSKIKLATGITLIPERNPLVLAKAISTLDLFSGGRVLLGIGAGWHREETEMMGGDFDHRWTQTKESILAMKELWTKDEAEFHGKYYDFPPVRMYPKPQQRPHPPVILGGMARNVFKRIIEWGDGWMPNRTTPILIEESRKTLTDLAKEAGRDPDSISITIYGQQPDLELIRSFHDAGANRVVVSAPLAEDEAEMSQNLEKIADAILK